MSGHVRKSVRDVRSRLKVESRERDTVTYYSDKDARRGRPKATRIPTERNFRCYGGKLINIIHQRITMRRHMHRVTAVHTDVDEHRPATDGRHGTRNLWPVLGPERLHIVGACMETSRGRILG